MIEIIMRHRIFFLFLLLLVLEASSSSIGSALSSSSSSGPLSRRRRFAIPSGSGAQLETAFTLTLPIRDAVWPVVFDIPFVYDFDTMAFTADGRRRRRSLYTRRHETLRAMEKHLVLLLPNYVDVHACALRAVCEAARSPLHLDGFLGALANAVLLGHEEEGGDREMDEYSKAEKTGQMTGDCSKYHGGCEHSIFRNLEEGDCHGNSTISI